MTRIRFYDQVEDQKLRFAVIVTKTKGHWVFCKHKERSTLEVPGGHREPGEDILATAKRELYEETGAVDFDIEPVCVYSVTAPGHFNGQETFGMLFYADVKAFEEELHSEIERIVIQDELPEAWTYPEIQPYLMEEVARRRGGADLAIRRMAETDLEPLYTLLSDPEVMRFLEPPYTREKTAEFLQAALSAHPPVYAVEADGTFIGYVIYHPYEPDSMEIGWVLLPAYWGQGYASRLTGQMIDQAAREGKTPVIECDPGQEATKHITRKYGFALTEKRNGLDVYRL